MAAESNHVRCKGRPGTAPGTPPPMVRVPGLRVEPRQDAAGVLRSAVIVSQGADQVDVTGALTGSLAHALWQIRAGEDIANWVDAERLLEQLLNRAAEPAAQGKADVVVPAKRSRAVR